jgi:hypothetical protein
VGRDRRVERLDPLEDDAARATGIGACSTIGFRHAGSLAYPALDGDRPVNGSILGTW